MTSSHHSSDRPQRLSFSIPAISGQNLTSKVIHPEKQEVVVFEKPAKRHQPLSFFAGGIDRS